MLLIANYVAPSSIEGVGVFAADAIPAGTLIWRLEPGLDRLLPCGEVPGLPAPAQAFVDRYGYPSPHDPEMIILEIDNGRFMNHSPRPNTRFDTPDAGYTRCDIAAGEELTCDYAEFMAGFEPPQEWASA